MPALKTAKPFIALLVLAELVPATQAHAQVALSGPDRVRQVIVYGDDACPPSSSDEITVCARLAEKERYRIPTALRTDPNDPRVQSWMNRAESIEYVGKSGTDSCSPVGGGGFTGCFQKLARTARAERQTLMGDVSWSNLVAEERAKRLSGLDAESTEVEARVKAEEAAEAARARSGNPTTSPGN